MKIILDGFLIEDKNDLFKYINRGINVKEFPITNLDALYDVITFNNVNIELTIINEEMLINNLGNYYNILLDTFNDFGKVNIIKK